MNKLFFIIAVVLLSVQLHAKQCFIPVKCNAYPTKLTDRHNTKVVCQKGGYNKDVGENSTREGRVSLCSAVSMEIGELTTVGKGKSYREGISCGEEYRYRIKVYRKIADLDVRASGESLSVTVTLPYISGTYTVEPDLYCSLFVPTIKGVGEYADQCGGNAVRTTITCPEE